jgi:hypothetical protein
MVENFESSAKRQKAGAFDDTDLKTQNASMEEKQLTILGEIKIGMACSKLSDILTTNGIKTIATNNTMTWSENGRVHIHDGSKTFVDVTYTTWRGKLTFRHDIAENISVDCQ